MKALIGTKNNAKIEGAKQALECFFDDVNIEGVKVSSDVSDEPQNAEIYQGARNRVLNLISYAKENNIEDVDYYMAIEAGITNYFGKWININIAVVMDKDGNESMGTGEAFPIPDKYLEEIKENGLGRVMDKIFNGVDLSKSVGGVSFITHETISRIDITKDAFIMAMTKFINDDIWSDKE